MPQHGSPGFRDDTFCADERLFRRYALDDLDGDGQPIASTLGFPGTSCVREKYTDTPSDVLHRDCCGGIDPIETGILVTNVRSVEDGSFEISGDGRAFKLVVKHRPEPTCLAHTEIWCCEPGQEPPPNPPPKVRRAFRAALALKLNVLVAATT